MRFLFVGLRVGSFCYTIVESKKSLKFKVNF